MPARQRSAEARRAATHRPDAGDASDASVTTTSDPDAGTIALGQCGNVTDGSGYSKYKKALFGILHQHTTYSLDAYGFGTRATPSDAYAFAKGTKSIQIAAGSAGPDGPTVTIDRPLDFLAVTDHSEWLGDEQAVAACLDKNNTSTQCQALKTQELTAWTDTQQAAANALDLCKFTSLVAYEWTSMPDDAAGNQYTNHRNVIFATDTVPTLPLDSDTFTTASALFQGLDQQCTGTCSALVVPHNSNLSEGYSLALPTSISPADLAAMQKYQRLVEIYQHKGSSECFYDTTIPEDQREKECSFEYLNPGSTPDTAQSYVRTALANGLDRAIQTGAANPLQLGIISSTDDHNGIAGMVNESEFVGHLSRTDYSAAERLQAYPDFGPGGLAVVWAEENTRPSIYNALQNRETYGTSGPRIQVRFYQTASTTPCTGDFPATIVDAGAIPMGGTFKGTGIAAGAAHFAIAAWPDDANQPLPDGTSGVAGLSSVAIVKAHGKPGATTVTDKPVNLSIAATGQCVPWTDTTFDPTEQAFYYVRVLQVPTWRWSHFDCQTRPGATGCEAGGTLDVTINERAWTSPIWVNP